MLFDYGMLFLNFIDVCMRHYLTLVLFFAKIFYMIYKCIREERRIRRHRLPKRMLKKLPIIKFTKNSDLAYDTCVICLDEFAEGDKLRVLPCRHRKYIFPTNTISNLQHFEVTGSRAIKNGMKKTS